MAFFRICLALLFCLSTAYAEVALPSADAEGLPQGNNGLVLLPFSFTAGKPVLTASSLTNLDRVARYLKAAQKARLRIEVHTDSRGTEEWNKAFSQARADAVASALVERGIAATRIAARGMGETSPIAPNNNEPNMAKNRRVWLFIE